MVKLTTSGFAMSRDCLISRSYRLCLYMTLLLVSGLVGCAGQQYEKTAPDFSEWTIKAKESRGFSPTSRKRKLELPEAVSPDELAPPAPAEIEKSLPTKRITLRMHDTDLRVLLRALVRAVDQNIILNDSVQGIVSLNVSKAPWDQVFTGLLNTHGLGYEWEGDIIRVVSPEDTSQRLKNLEAVSLIKQKKRAIELSEPLLTQVIPIDYADAAKLKENLENFLSESEPGKHIGSVLVDEGTNALIVKAMRSDLKQILGLIEKLDRPTRQILIEARIVEATRETARELGVQWGGLAEEGAWVYPGSNSTGVVGDSFSEDGIDPTSGWAVNFPATLASGTGLTLGMAVEEVGSHLLAVQLSALQQEGKLNILSSPSITTLDNQSAVIESGDEVPFQTVENGEVNIEYKKAVLSLEVTPHLIEGKTLKLSIITNKDELDFSRTVSGNPTIITKKAETNVILYDGQTTVIGGLNKETRDESNSGVPGLQDIPLLGYLFKGTSRSNRMEDVLIFITPHILGERGAQTPE
jgi:type IV pilus assembly protein PilQ